MEQLIQENLSTYGPWAVFALLMLSGFGLALGEEMVTIPAGMFIATGQLDFWPTAICAYVAIVLADCIWFTICRHYGKPLLHTRWLKRLVHPRRLLEMKHQFDRRGAWFIVMARFIPSSRTTAITVAGMFHMRFWKFALATAGCVLFTAPLQIGLGVLVGKGIGDRPLAEMLLHAVGLVALLIAITLVAAWWTRRRATRQRAPRARMSWIRRFRKRRKATAIAKAQSDSEQPAAGQIDPADVPEADAVSKKAKERATA